MRYREFSLKKKNGKARKICAPDKDLLKYQQSQLPRLLKRFFKEIGGTNVENIHHGFIKGRNVITAAEQHIGFKATIMMDISNFFDSVMHDMLPIDVRDWPFFHKEGGYTAQGFATSPILANIASIKMVNEINLMLQEYKPYAFTIYADDLQISLQTEDYIKLNNVILRIGDIVKSNLFEINTGKTRIKYAKYGYRRILGVNVGDTEVRATRKIMRKIRAAEKQKQKSSLGGLRNWAKCSRPKVVK